VSGTAYHGTEDIISYYWMYVQNSLKYNRLRTLSIVRFDKRPNRYKPRPIVVCPFQGEPQCSTIESNLKSLITARLYRTNYYYLRAILTFGSDDQTTLQRYETPHLSRRISSRANALCYPH
jgi:hypothetical protein